MIMASQSTAMMKIDYDYGQGFQHLLRLDYAVTLVDVRPPLATSRTGIRYRSSH